LINSARTNSRRRARLSSWRNLRAHTMRYFNSPRLFWIMCHMQLYVEAIIMETIWMKGANSRSRVLIRTVAFDELSFSSAGWQISDFMSCMIRMCVCVCVCMYVCTSKRIVLCAVYHRPSHLLSTMRWHARYKSLTISNVPERCVTHPTRGYFHSGPKYSSFSLAY